MRAQAEPFRVHVRRQNHADAVIVVRFEVKEGMGILGLRKVGREDPAPSIHYEEQEISPDSLRSGRFVHVLQSGQRQSYALSRITEDVAGRLPFDAWAMLSPVSEFGFRYLVVDENALVAAGSSTAQVVTSKPPQSHSNSQSPTGPTLQPPGVTAKRPRSVARAAPPSHAGRGITSADNRAQSSLPPRQTPIAPALAESVLGGLNQAQAIQLLKEEMAKVEDLHNRLAQVDSQLRASQAREQDLLEVMMRWQQL